VSCHAQNSTHQQSQTACFRFYRVHGRYYQPIHKQHEIRLHAVLCCAGRYFDVNEAEEKLTATLKWRHTFK
jgi:hypothetical protein